MAEETKPVEVKKDAVQPFDEAVDREFAPARATETPVPTPEPAPEPALPAPEQTPEPEKPTHDPETLQMAKELFVDQDIIDDLSPAQLRRHVTALQRHGREVYNYAKSQAPEAAKPEQAAPTTDEFKALEDSGIAPEIIAVLRKQKEDFSAQLGKLTEENKALKASTQTVEADRVRNHVRGLLATAGVADDFRDDKGLNRVIAALQAQYQFEQAIGEPVDEPTRLSRALAALGKAPKPKTDPAIEAKAKAEAEKKAAFEKAKAEYDAAALGEARTRKSSLSLDEKFAEWEKNKNRPRSEATVTEDEPSFTPLPG